MLADAEHTGIKQVVLDEIRELARRYGVKRVVLFGSRARGDYWRASDIDLEAEKFQDLRWMCRILHLRSWNLISWICRSCQRENFWTPSREKGS